MRGLLAARFCREFAPFFADADWALEGPGGEPNTMTP
jgi:hypothetical protein